MKKLLCLAFVLLLLCGCGNGPVIGEEFTGAVNTIEGLHMEVAADFTSRAATVLVVNDTGTDYVSDVLFSVQVEKDGRWYVLVNEYAGANISPLYVHRRNDITEHFCSWNHMYGSLPEGHYRIVKWMSPEDEGVKGEGCCMTAEFYIE